MYNEKVMDHFANPRNIGEVENADGEGEVVSQSCGDITKVTIKVNEQGIIEDVKFKTLGCGAAIASGSILTEMVLGKSLKEAMKITNKDVAEELGGLPGKKLHCSNLAADALQKAIESYNKSD